MSDQITSPFQKELFQHLLQNIQQKLQQSGLETEEEHKHFLHLLQDALKEKSVASLPEMIEKYYRFADLNLIFTEKQFLNFCQKHPLREKMLRGLPRLYKKNNPTQSKIKDGFTHLPSLKRLVMEDLTLPLYEKYKLPEHTKICLFTYFYSDGLGDLIALKEAYYILANRFPNIQIKTVLCIPENIDLQSKHLDLIDHVIIYQENLSLSSIEERILQTLISADLIISIPTFFPKIKELQALITAQKGCSPKILNIGQYGFLQSKNFDPKSNNYSMGLHPLEKGIFIRDAAPKADFRAVKNAQILQALFQTTTPRNIEIETYLQTNTFYFAYLSSSVGGIVYLHALLELEQSRNKNIDICTPNIHWLITYIKKQTENKKPFFLEDFPISEIEIHYAGKIYSQTLQNSGKKLRFIAPENLTDTDFRILLRLSNEFIAVRGDQSFSEAVSANKLFFYDGAPHANYFIKDLVTLAQSHLAYHSGACHYFQQFGKVFAHIEQIIDEEWVEESYFQEKEDILTITRTIVKSLRMKGTVTACKKLNQIIRKNYSFNKTFCQMVQREIADLFDPNFMR